MKSCPKLCPSPFVCPHDSLDFPKKSLWPATLVGFSCCQPGKERTCVGNQELVSLSPFLAAAAAGRAISHCSGALAPRPSRGCADSSARGSAGGGMWLPGRLVYCAGNKGTVVPGLLKCLGVWPLPCAGGWSTLGSGPGRGTLLRNASSSIAFCLGLGCPLTPPAGFMPRGVWCLSAPSLLPVLLAPQKDRHQALLSVQGMGPQCR